MLVDLLRIAIMGDARSPVRERSRSAPRYRQAPVGRRQPTPPPGPPPASARRITAPSAPRAKFTAAPQAAAKFTAAPQAAKMRGSVKVKAEPEPDDEPWWRKVKKEVKDEKEEEKEEDEDINMIHRTRLQPRSFILCGLFPIRDEKKAVKTAFVLYMKMLRLHVNYCSHCQCI